MQVRLKWYILVCCLFGQIYPIAPRIVEPSMKKLVHKIVLENGLTLLIRVVRSVPKVSIQLWYDVGSKDEETGEKGLAHLIEHMIFKGTAGEASLDLSESDINVIAQELSGSCNAFTWYDYTGYLFNLPSHTWKEALPIMADCMQNCAFKEDHLNSEMKAVIQELKMRKDNYEIHAAEALMSAIYAGHPYHYPVIGYKQDLWNAHANLLRDFYKKHYCPNNATLIIVGDVDVHETIGLVKKYFEHIPPKPDYMPETFSFQRDLATHTITFYRDVQQPQVMLAFMVPGASKKMEHVLEIGSLALGEGKGSRLYKKIVDDLQLATSLSTSTWEQFDSGLFFIEFEPKSLEDVSEITTIVLAELEDIAEHGLTTQELTRAINQVRMRHYNLMESTESQAYALGKTFLATGDENYIFTSLHESPEAIQKSLKDLYRECCHESAMHKATILPLEERDKPRWTQLQKESDAQDNRILSSRVRTSPVEPPSYAKTIKLKQRPTFDFPKPTVFTLDNGIKVLSYVNDNTAKIDLTLELKAKSFYEPVEQQGIYNFVMNMLTEGTEHYTGAQLAQEIEARGMNLAIAPGSITLSVLKEDLEKGLELIIEMLTNAIFIPEEIEKVREQLLVDIKNFWDHPSSCAKQLVRSCIYKGHPYSKNSLGVKDVIESLTRADLIAFYKKYISPSGAKLAIVGDLKGYNLEKILNKTIGVWKGPHITALEFPALQEHKPATITHPMDRDQVVLSFASPSIARKDPDFDKLFIFDQILGAGVLNSMSCRLFDLREQSGLFYTISGSLIAQANEQPGMVLVTTIVSLDRLDEAEEAIKNTLATAVDTLTERELITAKNAIVNASVLNFESNAGIAGAFLFLDRYGLPFDFFDKRAQQLENITVADVQKAVKRVLDANKLSIFKVGRVQEKKAS